MKKILLITFSLIVLLSIVTILNAQSFQIRLDNQAIISLDNKELLKNSDILERNSNHSWVTVSNSKTSNLQAKDKLSLEFNVEKAGEYEVGLTIKNNSRLYDNNLINIGSYERVMLDKLFYYDTNEFDVDRFNNEFSPQQSSINDNYFQQLNFTNNNNEYLPILIDLEAGYNQIELEVISGSFALINLKYRLNNDIISYDKYAAQNKGDKALNSIILEAEKFAFKNNSTINLLTHSSNIATPFSATANKLNTINNLNYVANGDSITYIIDVPEAGYYDLGLMNYMGYTKPGVPVFIDIYLDGEIPFSAFSNYLIPYNARIELTSIEEYPIYLSKGQHDLTIVLNSNNYARINNQLKTITDEITILSNSIKKITGNNQDKARDWDLVSFIPDLNEQLDCWYDELVLIQEELLMITNGVKISEYQQIEVAKIQLDTLRNDPNMIATNMNILAVGSGSILQQLATTQMSMNKQGLGLDKIVFSGTDTTLVSKPNTFSSIYVETQRFLSSFEDRNTFEEGVDTIDIWVRRPRQNVAVLQQMIDESFTPQTGIKVNVSVMPDQGKLTLANAANKQPDGAIGIDSWLVNDLALRNALVDLRQFEGINNLIDDVAPGALIQMIIDESLYGLPETQDFYVMYYRKDILEEFDLEIPETWDDVLLMLPVLQRYGMNFYTPLASADAYKSWPSTAPYYFQNNAAIFSEDGSKTIIDSEEGVVAMQQMSDLFTIYGMPIQVASFYNSFRFGEIPIGISNFSTYAQLKFSAPEISDQWEVALVPGIKQADGTINRQVTGGSTAVTMFNRSNKQNETYAFYEWYLSEAVQIEYATRMQNIYGTEFMWNSANRNTLNSLPIIKDDAQIIDEQLNYIQEVPRVPGSYFVEREVSNAWNRIVFDGYNVRSSVTEASIKSNREIKRKLEEFGYNEDNPFILPSIAQVERWLNDEE